MIKPDFKNKSLPLVVLLFTIMGSCSINVCAAHSGGGHGSGGRGGFSGGGRSSGFRGEHGNGAVRINTTNIYIQKNSGARSAGSWHDNGYGHGGYYHGGRGVYWHGGRGYWSGSSWFWNGAAIALIVGAMVATLPPSYQTVYVQNVPYYYYNNVYYRPAADGYVVVDSPY